MTKSHILSFLCGGLAVLGVTMIASQSHAQAPNHVYELRTYTAPPGKLDALKPASAIIPKPSSNATASTPSATGSRRTTRTTSSSTSSSTRAKRTPTKNWAAFQADDEWKKVRAESEAGGPLTTKAPDSVYMNPTDFSRLK